MKKKGIKRALAFLLAVVFAFSTCMTAGPYTVQATEAGQTGSGEEEVGGGTTPDQGGTVDEKLSVKVVNNASIDIGPGLSDVNLKLTYNNGTEASLTIGKDQIGETVNTDISYDEVVAGTYDVVISDTNGLYNVTAETGIDEASKTLMITITGLSVKTDDNSISGAADDTVYAADENTFSVVGSWANYIDTWEIRDNTSGATIEENGKNCKVTTSRGSQDGAPAAFTIVAKVGTQEIASKLVTVKRKPTSLSVSSGEENGWLFSKEVTFTFTLKSGDTLVGDRTITGNYPENKGTTTFDCVTNENGEATHTVKLKKWQKDLAITGKFDGDNIYEPADIQGRYALNKYTGKILFEEETNPNKYSSENPLVVTYGTKDTELPITLCDTNGQSVEKDENESVETVDAVSDNSALVTVSADKTTKTVTITPKRAFTQPVRVTITGQTTNYKFSRDIYVQVDPYPLKIKEDSVHVFAPGKVNVEGAVEGEKIYDGTTKVDVKATLEAVEDDKYIPTDAAKGEIEAYKEVIFKNYDSKLKNVAENEAAQKMYFKPETLNNNVEFVSASATDIATFTNNYKIQDKRPSIEKELTIQKRVLELSVGNTSRGFRDLDYTRALDTLVSVNATTGETGFVTGEGTDLKGFKFPNVVDTTATDLNAENVKTKDTASYGEHAGALKLQADDQTNPTNNYKFDLIDYTSGNVEITEEKNVEGYVSVRTDSIHAYEAEDSTRYYGKDANVKFALTGDYNVIYSCDENGQNANNISESGLSLIGETKDIDRYFYLTNEVNGATIAKTQVFRLHFLYDETAPNCKQIAFGNQGGVVSNLEQAITFGIYKNHTIEATVTLSDDGSGVNGMAYFVANTATDKNYKDLLTEDDYAEALANEHFTDAGKPDENNTWTIKNIGKLKDGETIESNNYIVFVKAKDNVGNVRIYGSNGIVLENLHDISVTYTESADGTVNRNTWTDGITYYSGNADLNLKAEENAADPKFYSGLEQMGYQVSYAYGDGSKETKDQEVVKNEYPDKVSLGKLQEYCTITKDLQFANDPKRSQVITVTAAAADTKDNAGNTMDTDAVHTLVLDSVSPVVTSSWAQVNNNKEFRHGKYANSNVTYEVTVQERFLKDLIVTINDKDYTLDQLEAQKDTLGIGTIKKDATADITKTTVTFSGDSDYTVSYDCYDLAGNKSNTENLEEFTVDKTVPVIKVSYNNNSALNGNYYKAARTATITVTEHNFDPSKITVSTTASAGGAPGVSGWSNNGDTHTANVVFNHDADYTFTVSGFDLAENKAADYAQDKFTVDLKNPEVKITGVKDKSANNGTVAPHISISDTNFITSGVKVTLKGANRGDVKIDSLANITSSATGMNVIFKDFPEGMDDIYTLTAKVTDKAGNETTSSITFSVNRDGSTYEIGSSTKALIDKKYTNKPQDLEITEINVDDLTTIEITYSLDGKVVTLKEGEDYTITKSGEDGQWKKYVYKIKASCFEKEGNYVTNIYSEDAAHNSTTNKTKAKTIEFTVDKTAPTMVVSNLADRGRYKENTHEFTLNVKDNIYLAYVEVYLDGELFKRFEEDEIAQLNGELLVDIASSNQYQTIELVSCDKAGNISKEVYDPETNKQVPASYKVLVTQNSFVQFINNTPLLISVIVIFVAIIVLIIVLVKRKKDKQK